MMIGTAALVLIIAAALFGLVLIGALVAVLVASSRRRDSWQNASHTPTRRN